MSLPATGDPNWGVPLNQYILTVVLAQANAASAAIGTHQAGTDPHGDRAYALGLVAPLTTGVNGPSGFLQLNSIGKIPNGVLPAGGGRTAAFDVVKDYSAPTNGSTDAAPAIQSALNDCGTLGGGEVWVGDGNFALGSTLYIPGNVWLHLSPGANMTRILNAGSGVAPAYMLANFNGSVSSSGSGNILVEGGSWTFDSQSAAGTPMAFVGGTSILVRNTSIRTLALSPAILFAGCFNFAAEDIQYSTATPALARSAYISAPPAVRIESAASAVISGLNSSMYTGTACSLAGIKNCSITGTTASDGTGLFTAFGGLAGTTAPVSGSFHNNIIVTGNNAVALPYNGVYAANWQTVTVVGNQLNLNNGQTAYVTWSPSAPATTNQIVANNGASDSVGLGNGHGYKTGSTSRTGTGLSVDPDLQATVVAGAVYEVRCSVAYSTSNSSLKYDFTVPSGSFTYTTTRQVPNTFSTGFGSATISVSETVQNSSGTTDSADTTGTGVQILGILSTGGSGGTFGLLWAQQTNQPGYPTSLLAGSYLYLTRIA